MVMGSIPTGDAVTGSCILWNPDAPASAEQKGRSVLPLLLSHYTTFRPPLLALKFVSLVRKETSVASSITYLPVSSVNCISFNVATR